MKSGRCPSVIRQKLKLRVGQTFIVQVVPQISGAKIEIAAEPPLQTLVPASRIEGGPVPTYHAEFSGGSGLRIAPIPTTGKLHVTVIDGLPAPCRITIPVTVWPAYSTLVLWWLVTFLSIVGLRWQRTVAEGQSFADILRAMWGDLPHLLELLALGSLILVPLRMVGWLVSLAESGEDSG
jgi:hypothetical protein